MMVVIWLMKFSFSDALVNALKEYQLWFPLLLTKLINLTELDISNNSIITYDTISGLTNLKKLIACSSLYSKQLMTAIEQRD